MWEGASGCRWALGKIVCALVSGRVSVLTLSITEEVLTQMRGLFNLCGKH